MHKCINSTKKYLYKDFSFWCLCVYIEWDLLSLVDFCEISEDFSYNSLEVKLLKLILFNKV